ncbi:hypothetical protein DM860_012822 [Cuscuta australis]|uniref:Cyclin-dependent kinase inhibitor domain-containing protein n=1 Tax=Cuscuta australis TaxID=267555 RepID=A0A328DYF1_9ASTE|nr:hypothetical protein DM860_012822 [Cuscuta australis]
MEWPSSANAKPPPPPADSPGRKPDAANAPPSAEVHEFFSAAEKCVQKRFAEQYNYDIVKDEPLEGRYMWLRFNPK